MTLAAIKVKPRDVKVGDVVTRRYGRGINERFVDLTVRNIVKRVAFGKTIYRIVLTIPIELHNRVDPYFEVRPSGSVEVKR